jgi:UDP-2-acetamido-3-amino-2,3-dideoxy-glucuronate N-acetyltransferase
MTITCGKGFIKEDGVVLKGDKSFKFGNNVRLCANAIIHSGVIIGNNVLIGDGACVREGVIIGDYTVIGRAVTIENNTTIGKNVRIQAHAYVTAYCKIEDYVFIAPCVATSNDNFMARGPKQFTQQNGCTIRRGARVGVGAVILPNIEIGENAFVAAGSLVTRNVPPRVYVKGSPAKPYKDVPKEEWI